MSSTIVQAAKRMGPGRDRILNDVMNTVVAAALIGGFALGNISGVSTVGEKTIDKIIYMLSFVAVHACTCSCLTSAMTYRKVNSIEDGDCAQWAQDNWLLLKLSWMKFVMGCTAYIISVIFLSWKALEPHPELRYTALVIGLMSMSTVVMSYGMLSGLLPVPALPFLNGGGLSYPRLNGGDVPTGTSMM